MSEEILTLTFTELRKGFLRLARRFLPNEEDANDALQDAFCRLWPHRNEIVTRGQAEAITVTTVRNLCIDTLRRKKIDTVELNLNTESVSTESPIEQLEREELFKKIEVLIETELTEIQREIFQKKEYQELSIEEIANELDMQSGAVRVQLSRARKKIRDCYRSRISDDKY